MKKMLLGSRGDEGESNMGLFDWVELECELPKEISHLAGWQTKDLDDPYMRKVKITKEGRLLLETFHYEDKSEPNAKPGSLESVFGCQTPVHEGWEDLNFHGIFHFHELDGARLIICAAKFTDGNLVGITHDGETELPRQKKRDLYT